MITVGLGKKEKGFVVKYGMIDTAIISFLFEVRFLLNMIKIKSDRPKGKVVMPAAESRQPSRRHARANHSDCAAGGKL
jgi:hypothetical protein